VLLQHVGLLLGWGASRMGSSLAMLAQDATTMASRNRPDQPLDSQEQGLSPRPLPISKRSTYVRFRGSWGGQLSRLPDLEGVRVERQSGHHHAVRLIRGPARNDALREGRPGLFIGRRLAAAGSRPGDVVGTAIPSGRSGWS